MCTNAAAAAAALLLVTNPICLPPISGSLVQPPDHDTVQDLLRKYDADGTGHLDFEVGGCWRCAEAEAAVRCQIAPAGWMLMRACGASVC